MCERVCARVEECGRAREFAKSSTNGGMIVKERERDGERSQRGKSGPGTA